MPAPETPNTSEVARRLGVSRAAVSRFRNGLRVPILSTRLAIVTEFGWSIEAQARAEAEGRWAEEFNKALKRAHAAV